MPPVEFGCRTGRRRAAVRLLIGIRTKVPVLEHLQGIRAIAVDRPGHGLSDPPPVAPGRFRGAAVEFIDEVMAALRLDTVTLVGQSGGGVRSL
jgi:pimeloyl-ACP methyl ester carboxylesterase